MPNHDLIKEKPSRQLIQKENLSDLLRKPRNIRGPKTGFGSILPRHNKTFDQRCFETTNGSFYGAPLKETATNIVNAYQTLSKISAGKEPEEKSKEKRNVFLVGEVLRKCNDPQKDTEAQRSWINLEDPGITAVDKGKVPKGIPEYDNALSLALGKGCRIEMPIKTEPGDYRKIREDVTLVPQWNCSSRFK